MTPSRRGLTLIEVLLSVALLALLASAIASITAGVARAQRDAAPRIRCQMMVAALLGAIRDDLHSGDFEDGRPRDERVWLDSAGALHIRTRRAGAMERVYHHDGDANLIRVHQSPDGSMAGSEGHVALENVDTWRCTIDDERDTLLIEIESSLWGTAHERYVL